MTPSKHSYQTAASLTYINATKTQENDLKSNCTKMIKGFKKKMNKSLKGIQENTIKQIEVVKEETNPLMTYGKMPLNR
jgi:gas vesicle protein